LRELLYLSVRKLEEFQTAERAGLMRRLTGEVNLSIFGSSLRVGPGANPSTLSARGAIIRKMDMVVDHINSAASPVWYKSADHAGQWVQFEVGLHYCIFPGSNLFMAWETIPHYQWSWGSGDPDRDYPDPGPPRIILHGSANHVVGSTSTCNDSAMVVEVGQSSRYSHFVNLLEMIFGAAPFPPGVEPDPGSTDFMGHLYQTLTEVEGRVDAGWFAGYARLSTIPQRGCLMASPLYVERVGRPASW
jgi:hypothetical protein